MNTNNYYGITVTHLCEKPVKKKRVTNVCHNTKRDIKKLHNKYFIKVKKK